ncbi:FepD ABC-type Fe3+-siderophore transport system, permease component [Candidatus Nanopelagicaceae bacterium]
MKTGEIDRIWHWQITAVVGAVLFAVLLLAVSFGPISLDFVKILRTLFGLSGGLQDEEKALFLQLRLPRVLLAALVGAALATSGAVYQTVFRNPLADPYLLGAAAGAGLGATLALTGGSSSFYAALPLFAFIGAALAVAATFLISGRSYADPAMLLLSGIAIGSFATAVQTYLQQRNSEVLRPVYSWILGQLTVADWQVVKWASFYIVLALAVLIRMSRLLDGLLLSDEEAFSLGISPNKVRIIAIGAATLATATAVSASGLIGFVGIVVPHLVRGITKRATNRALFTVALFGAAFLVLADLGARTLLSPAELPIGVITAFVGAPFLLFVLRAKRVLK